VALKKIVTFALNLKGLLLKKTTKTTIKMKKICFILFASLAIVSCKKEEIKTMEGTYSGNITLTTMREGVVSSNEFAVSVGVEFKGNNHILIESFYTDKIPYNSSQKTFRREEGANGYYYGYFTNDSLFLEFNGGKSGTTYYYNLKKNL